MRKILFLLLALAAILILPYLGAVLSFSGSFPPGYFDYPPVKAAPKAGFSWVYFILGCVIGIAVLAVYLFPRLFGFKKPEIPSEPEHAKVSFPKWFWVGLVMWGVTLFVLWGKFSEPKWLINWADLPLFWGITFTLDGIVYKRTGGKSIMGTNPREIIGIGVASMGGWMLFEYLNFFVENNWIYPSGVLISPPEFLLYAILGSSGLMPMCFMMYGLLKTFKKLRHRFDNGPVVKSSRTARAIMLIIAMAGLFITGLLPNNLFFLLWLCPITILIIVLEQLDIWTPFRYIREKGNWSPVLVFALTYLFVGFLLEGQNYFSGFHVDGEYSFSYNPSYWVYSIPFLDVIHVFEMPTTWLFGVSAFFYLLLDMVDLLWPPFEYSRPFTQQSIIPHTITSDEEICGRSTLYCPFPGINSAGCMAKGFR